MSKFLSVIFAALLFMGVTLSASAQTSDCSTPDLQNCEGAGTLGFSDDGSMRMTIVMSVGDASVVGVATTDLGTTMLLSEFEDEGMFISEEDITEDVEDEFAFLEELDGEYRVFEGTSNSLEQGQDANFVIVTANGTSYFIIAVGVEDDVLFPWVEELVTEEDITIVPEDHMAIPLD